MFPSIQDKPGIKSVELLLNTRSILSPPTLCIPEVLRLCLECNNYIFNNKFHLQTDGTAQGPHMPCCYSNIAMAVYDEKAMDKPIKMQIIICIIPTPLMHRARFDLLWKLKMKMALNF